jgi:hypothetical protein
MASLAFRVGESSQLETPTHPTASTANESIAIWIPRVSGLSCSRAANW